MVEVCFGIAVHKGKGACAYGRSIIRTVEKGIAAVQDVRGRTLQLLEGLADVLIAKELLLATHTSGCQQDSETRAKGTSLNFEQHLGAGSSEAQQQHQMQQDVDAGLKQDLAQMEKDIIYTEESKGRVTKFHLAPRTTAVQIQQQSISALLSLLHRRYEHLSNYRELVIMAQQNPQGCCAEIMAKFIMEKQSSKNTDEAETD